MRTHSRLSGTETPQTGVFRNESYRNTPRAYDEVPKDVELPRPNLVLGTWFRPTQAQDPQNSFIVLIRLDRPRHKRTFVERFC